MVVTVMCLETKTTLSGRGWSSGGLSVRSVSADRTQAPALLVAPGPPGQGRGAHLRSRVLAYCLNAQAVAVPELLNALLTAPGPSGHEEEPARVWRAAGSNFAEVTSVTLGTSFARMTAAAPGAPTLALVGHLDENGVTVTNIEENG